MIEAPILGYPDITKPYSLYTDASDYSIGGILTQDISEGENTICYVSHQLTSSRLHYPVIEKECFAIIYCLTKLLKSLFTAEMKKTHVSKDWQYYWIKKIRLKLNTDRAYIMEEQICYLEL